MLWRCARQPGTVSNILNAQQSEIFTKFPQKATLKPRESVRCLLRNVKRFQKLFWLCSWWNILAWAYYKIAMVSTQKNFCSDSQSDFFTKFPLLSTLKPLAIMRCLFRNVKQFYELTASLSRNFLSVETIAFL